ncbi:hypothetical protein GGR75_003764, partial [Xanthomonas campestris]|nr:hypothetical protein [Xanthomonas campestris]
MGSGSKVSPRFCTVSIICARTAAGSARKRPIHRETGSIGHCLT